MPDLFKNMLKEEWRIHTTILGNVTFIVFPLIVILLILLLSMFAPLIQRITTESFIFLILHFIFIFFGLNVGAFGIYGKDFMNKRFSHANLLAFSSRTLPLSDRHIFMTFILKDIFYYLFLFIIPAIIGIVLASLLFNAVAFAVGKMVISLILSFLIGLSFIFFLSTLYAHSSHLLAVFMVFFVGFLSWVEYTTTEGIIQLYAPLRFYTTGDILPLVVSATTILVPFTISILFFRIESSERKERYKEQFTYYTKKFKRSGNALLLAKDALQLRRSRGGVGRIIFSLVIPMALIWVFLTLFVGIIPYVNFLVMFSVFLGIYTPSIYNWLSTYDSYATYSFLPIEVHSIIRSKLQTTMHLALTSVIIFLMAAVTEAQSIYYGIPTFVAFVSLFLYGVSLTVYLTGLYPNILFYKTRNLLLYLILTVTPALAIIFISLIHPYMLLLTPLLLVVGYGLLQRGLSKWNRLEHTTGMS